MNKINIINKISENYITYETKHDISNVFNLYFESICKRISELMNAGPYDHCRKVIILSLGRVINSSFFAPVSSADV